MQIKEAARLLNVTPRTLRRWEKRGKLHVKRHPINNYRLYDETEIMAIKNQLNTGGENE
jgi:excisionase family DNA binding protein